MITNIVGVTACKSYEDAPAEAALYRLFDTIAIGEADICG